MIETIAVTGIIAVVIAIGGIWAMAVGVARERRAWTRRIRQQQRDVEELLPRRETAAAVQAQRLFGLASAIIVGEALDAAEMLGRTRGRRDALANLVGTGRAAATTTTAGLKTRPPEGNGDGDGGDGEGDGGDGEVTTVASRAQVAFERNGGTISTRVGGRTE